MKDAADKKVAAIDAAAKAGQLKKTWVDPEDRKTNQRVAYEKGCGPIPPGCDLDRVLDLQLGGANTIENMSPLALEVNRSLGAQVCRRLKGFPYGTPILGATIS